MEWGMSVDEMSNQAGDGGATVEGRGAAVRQPREAAACAANPWSGAGVDPSGWDHPQPHVLAVSPQAADIDGLDHTNNAVYVQWCERVAWSHSEHLGLSLDDYRRLDRAMAIRQGVYDYLLPSFLGEPLLLGTWLTAGDGKLAMQRSFQLRRASDGQTLMRGRWELVCIEISTGRPRRMPPEFVQVYQAVVVTSDASVAARNPSTA
jgi:acyl-CoA thioester hydrolase